VSSVVKVMFDLNACRELVGVHLIQSIYRRDLGLEPNPIP